MMQRKPQMHTGDSEHVLDNRWELRETQPSPLQHRRDLHTPQQQFSIYHWFVSPTAQLPHSPSYLHFHLPPSPSHVLLLPLPFYSRDLINWRVVGVIPCSFMNPKRAHISLQYCLSLEKRQSTIKGVSQ